MKTNLFKMSFAFALLASYFLSTNAQALVLGFASPEVEPPKIVIEQIHEVSGKSRSKDISYFREFEYDGKLTGWAKKNSQIMRFSLPVQVRVQHTGPVMEYVMLGPANFSFKNAQNHKLSELLTNYSGYISQLSIGVGGAVDRSISKKNVILLGSYQDFMIGFGLQAAYTKTEIEQGPIKSVYIDIPFEILHETKTLTINEADEWTIITER